MPNLTTLTVGELLTHQNTLIRRAARSLLAQLEKYHREPEPLPDDNQIPLPLPLQLKNNA